MINSTNTTSSIWLAKDLTATKWQNYGFNLPVSSCSPPSAQGSPSAGQNFQDDFPAFEPVLYFSQLQGGLGWVTSAYSSSAFSFLDLLLGSVKESNSRKNSNLYIKKPNKPTKSNQTNPTDLEENSKREHHKHWKWVGVFIESPILPCCC